MYSWHPKTYRNTAQHGRNTCLLSYFSFVDRSNASRRFGSVGTLDVVVSWSPSTDQSADVTTGRQDLATVSGTRLARTHGKYVHGLYKLCQDDRPYRYPNGSSLRRNLGCTHGNLDFASTFDEAGRIEPKSLDRINAWFTC